MDDNLFNVRNALYLGNYQQAISEALSSGGGISHSPKNVDKQYYMYRAYVELRQYRAVLDEVQSDAPPALQAVRLLATYLDGSADTKEAVLLQLKEYLDSAQAAGCWQMLVVAGMIYIHERDYKEALRLLHQNTQLDVMAIVAQIYLLLDRPDLARRQVGAMQEQDDDATLTKLANAWVALSEGGEKCQDALYEFQELGEKYSMSLMLLNSLALTHLHLGKFDEAERLLQEALGKSATDADTLANLVVCYQHLNKPSDVIARYSNQLRAVAPNHPWAAKCAELEASFALLSK